MIKTSELTGAALDWAVAIAEGIPPEELRLPRRGSVSIFRYLRDADGNLNGRFMTGPDLIFSRKWEAGGPIIDREFIGTEPVPGNDEWVARIVRHEGQGAWNIPRATQYGRTPLIAAMRCYVAAKLGTEVDVPQELLS